MTAEILQNRPNCEQVRLHLKYLKDDNYEFNPAQSYWDLSEQVRDINRWVGKGAQAKRKKPGAIWSNINKNVVQSPVYMHIAEKGIINTNRTTVPQLVPGTLMSPATAPLPDTFQHKVLPPAFGYSLLFQFVALPFVMKKEKEMCTMKDIYIYQLRGRQNH